jgi:hypothetical protein
MDELEQLQLDWSYTIEFMTTLLQSLENKNITLNNKNLYKKRLKQLQQFHDYLEKIDQSEN